METFVIIALAGAILAALMPAQPSAPPPPIIFVSPPSERPAESGCLPLFVLGLLVMFVVAAAQG